MTEDKKVKTIELVDADGQAIKFDILAPVEMNHKEYVVAMPYDEVENEPEEDPISEVVILEVIQENDEDIFIAVEDDTLLDQIFAKFLEENPEFAD